MLYGSEASGFNPLVTEQELRIILSPAMLPHQLTDANLASFGYRCVEPKASTVFETEDMIVVPTAIEVDGVMVRSHTLAPVDAEKKLPRLYRKWAWLRAKRNAKLLETDYLFLSDVPNPNEVLLTEYRQLLRDITDVADPFLAVFPDPTSYGLTIT